MSPKILALIAIFWAGMVTAISFLESWVKFRTPTLQKSVGFDVGRTVFGFFNKVQVILLVIIFITAYYAIIDSMMLSVLLLLTAIILIQNIWLFPKLAKRVDLVIQGNPLPPSKVHALYGILEIAKLFVLLFIGCSSLGILNVF